MSSPSLPQSHGPVVTDPLLARLRAGDVAAFEQLFRDMHEPLVAFGTRFVSDAARAEELVQDLFFDLWHARADWPVRTTLRSYLFSALRNRALNVRRRDAVERDWAYDEAHDAVRALHPRPLAADHALVAAEEHAAVANAFARLPERCRLAMHLRWRDGLSYLEIAEVLGIGVKSVENHLARGLKSLRTMVLGE